MVDGSTYERKVLAAGKFEQLFEYIETRHVDPDQLVPVHVPKEFVLLSDYPRTMYRRDQVIENSGIHLNKKSGMSLARCIRDLTCRI